MRDARFTRRARLTEPHQFKAVFAAEIRQTAGGLTVLAKPNTLDHPRLGLAIAKKHVPSAVMRNRIKRATRESFRLLQSELRGLDIVVLSRPGIARLSRPQIRASLQEHWSRLIKRCKKS